MAGRAAWAARVAPVAPVASADICWALLEPVVLVGLARQFQVAVVMVVPAGRCRSLVMVVMVVLAG